MASELRPIEGAPREGRHLLGVLMAQRRVELGYTHWPAFARDRLPLTPSGKPNTRLLADLEKAYRDTFPEPRLRQLAQVYQVTYASMIDVAHLRADALTPAPPVAAPAQPPPAAEPPLIPAAKSWYDQIRGRLDLLRAQGVTSPSGGQLFPGEPDDAQAWDDARRRLEDTDDRAWFIALLRLHAGGRDGSSGTGTDGP